MRKTTDFNSTIVNLERMTSTLFAEGLENNGNRTRTEQRAILRFIRCCHEVSSEFPMSEFFSERKLFNEGHVPNL